MKLNIQEELLTGRKGILPDIIKIQIMIEVPLHNKICCNNTVYIKILVSQGFKTSSTYTSINSL